MRKLEDIMKDFSEWMEDNTLDDLFESPEEAAFSRKDNYDTYEVTIKGLNYRDAQNAMDFGLEFGKSASIRIEEGDE